MHTRVLQRGFALWADTDKKPIQILALCFSMIKTTAPILKSSTLERLNYRCWEQKESEAQTISFEVFSKTIGQYKSKVCRVFLFLLTTHECAYLLFVGTTFLQTLHAVAVVHIHCEQTGREVESPLALG